jgi:tetratricopeptide (TPR) repeat protein
MTTLKKKIVFAISTFLIFLLIMIGIEIGLRVLYPDLRPPLVTEVSYDGIQWYQINRSYLRKYFSSHDYIVPEFKPTLFRKEKTPDTFRILCIGESSMFGVPYQMTSTIPGIVRKQLRHLYPGKEIEVINLGASAINTNVILDVSREFLSFQLDLVLLYAGHNEFYGPDGVGASFLERQFPFLTPLKYSLRDLAIFELLRSILVDNSSRPNAGEDMTLMQQVSQNNKVSLHSQDADRIFVRFESNLKSLIEIYRARHIPIVVSDVTSNLTFPPFSSTSDQWGGNEKKHLRDAEALTASGNFEAALSALHNAAALDSTDARVNFLLGIVFAAKGNFQEAKRFLVAARDNDLLKFRAPERINAIIKEVCARELVPCISSDSLFESQSRNGISGNELFWEHLHPTPKGYYQIADLYVREIEKQKYLSSRGHESSSTQLLPFNTDSLSICWLDLAYGDISIRNLTNKWPFNNYSVTPIVMASADAELQRIAAEVYGQKIVWDMGCYESAQYFWKKGRMREAITTYEALLEDYPYNFYTHYLLASILTRQKMLDDAVRHYAISISSNPKYPYSRLELALIQINMGQFDEAIGHLTKAVELTADGENPLLKANAYYGLAVAYANKKEFQKAISFVDASLKINPTYSDALLLRSKIIVAAR